MPENALTPSARTMAVAAARWFAEGNGDEAPWEALAFVTTRSVSAKLTGASWSVDTADVPSLVIRLRGQFTAYLASRPYGAEPPQGDCLVVAIDPSSGKVTDWGVGPASAYPMDSLGAGASLDLTAAE